MKLNTLRLSVYVAALHSMSTFAHAEVEARGNVGMQLQFFPAESVHEAEHRSNYSLSGEIEFYTPLGENGSLTVTPFLRVDQNDSERSHVDLREFLYSTYGDEWELNVGLRKVFWGVAESSNLVDVINQNDTVENDGASAKLGQPVVNLLLSREWGDIDLYVLPGFREATLPGINGRPRPPITPDVSSPLYESSDRSKHIDVAARVSFVIDEWDFGAHVFHGTARDPLFRFNPSTNTVVPFYYQHTQVGLDIQATLESWLLKAEMVYRSSEEVEDHAALVTGFEYSFYDIKESGADLGIVSEWLYDGRGRESNNAFQNDLFLGLRVALNDEQSLEGLLGVIADLDGGGQLLSLEGSRRFGDSFKASLQMSIFQDVSADSVFGGFDKEDNLQFEISYFF